MTRPPRDGRPTHPPNPHASSLRPRPRVARRRARRVYVRRRRDAHAARNAGRLRRHRAADVPQPASCPRRGQHTGRQPGHERRRDARARPLLRRAPLAEREHRLRLVPPPEPRLLGPGAPQRGLRRRHDAAQLDGPRLLAVLPQRPLLLGRARRDARGAGAPADPGPRRDGHDAARGHGAARGDRLLPGPLPERLRDARGDQRPRLAGARAVRPLDRRTEQPLRRCAAAAGRPARAPARGPDGAGERGTRFVFRARQLRRVPHDGPVRRRPGAQQRPRRDGHGRRRGRRALQGRLAAQHRPHGALHARRPLPDARAGRAALRLGRPGEREPRQPPPRAERPAGPAEPLRG